MNFFDAIVAWLATNWDVLVVPVTISLVALWVSTKSLKFERLSADAAIRSANAAERSNLITERMVNREHLLEGPESERPNIEWRVEKSGDDTYLLRNIGTDVAEDVVIPKELTSGISRYLPDGATIRPGDAVQFVLIGAWGSPKPHTLYVQALGQEDPTAVPVPQQTDSARRFGSLDKF